MEVRCESCSKLFRISDEKIIGEGIKFACTRCGSPVKITKEEFETYVLAKTAVSTLDLFVPRPKKAKTAQVSEEGGAGNIAIAPVEQQGFDLSAPAEHEPPVDEHPPVFKEPVVPVEQAPVAVPAPSPQTQTKLAPEPKAVPAIATKDERKALAEPYPAKEAITEQKTTSVQTPIDTKTANTAMPEAVRPAVSPTPRPAPSVPPAPSKKELVHPAPLAAERSVMTEPTGPSHAGRKFLTLSLAIILIGIAGYGVFFYFQTVKKHKNVPLEMTSIEGLQITNATGAVESTGDLLITGVIENSADREKAAWYVVVDIYDAQGAVMDKIRLLNGKQIFTRRDYDILASRGVNIQDLKTKSLQEQGVVVPPKGSITFEIRYLQPPVGIASFNATLQPFDPVRLFKEIAEDSK